MCFKRFLNNWASQEYRIPPTAVGGIQEGWPLANPLQRSMTIGRTFFALFAASASLGKYYPWFLPMNLFIHGRFNAALVLGIAGGIIATLAGLEFVRRDVM